MQKYLCITFQPGSGLLIQEGFRPLQPLWGKVNIPF